MTRRVAVRFDRVSKAFGAARRPRRRVVRDPARAAPSACSGRSGTGKSVTLRHIVGLVTAGQRTGVRRRTRHHDADAGASSARCASTWASCFRTRRCSTRCRSATTSRFRCGVTPDWSDGEIRERATKKLAGRRARDGVRQDAGRPVRRHEEARRARPRDGARSGRSCSSTSRAPASIRSPPRRSTNCWSRPSAAAPRWSWSPTTFRARA